MKFNEFQHSSDECLNIYDNFLNSSRTNSSDNSCAQVGLINSIRNSGLNYILHKLLSNEQNKSINDNW